MRLEGSCHCGAVKFRLDSVHPYPFMRCYCSICRKTAGGGGYAINLGGDHRTLKIQGKKTSRSIVRSSRMKTLADANAARAADISASVAAAHCGYGTRNGPISCTRTHRPSTPIFRFRRSTPT